MKRAWLLGGLLTLLATLAQGVAPPSRRVDFLGDPLPPGAVARFGTLRLRPPDGVRGLQFSPDGKYIITPSDGKLLLWSASTGTLVRELRVSQARGRLLLSCDNKRVASKMMGSDDVGVFDAATGELLLRSRAEQDDYVHVISPDGKLVALGGMKAVIHLHQVDKKAPPKVLKGHQYAISELVFSPDGRLLASTESAYTSRKNDAAKVEHMVRVWDVATGKQVQQFSGKIRSVRPLLFSPDSKSLLIGRGKIREFNLETGKQEKSPGNPDEDYDNFAVSPDGKYIAFSADRKVEIWSRPGNTLLRTIAPVDGRLEMVFSPDSRVLAVPCADRRTIQVHDVKSGKRMAIPSLPPETYTAFRVSPDGKTIAIACDDSSIRLRDFSTGKMLQTLEGHTGFVRGLLFSPDGTLLVSMANGRSHRFPEEQEDRCLRVWRVSDGKAVRRCFPVSASPASIAFFPDSKAIAIASLSRAVATRFEEVVSGKTRSISDGPMRSSHRVAVSADNKLLALVEAQKFGTDMGPVYLYDLATGKESGSLPIMSKYLFNLTFSPDGQRLAIGDGRGMIHVWDAKRRRGVMHIRRHEKSVGAPAFSPDGQLLVADGQGAVAHVWEVATGHEVLTFRGHRPESSPSQRRWQAQFTPDGKRFATFADDRTILVWDLDRCPDLPKETPAQAELWKAMEQATPEGFRAGLVLARKPEQAVAFLARQLRAVPKRDEKQIKRLLAQLDSEESYERERASKELRSLGTLAEPELQSALKKPASAEVARRSRELLAALAIPAGSGEELRALRAISVLERIGTAAAREVLQTLATGEPLAKRTRGAQAALKRLRSR